MSWPLVALSELCEINIGKTPARAKDAYWGVGHPWLSIADMNQGLNLSETKEQITDAAVKETNIKLVPKGTVLFSFKLSIGKIGVAQIPLYTNEAIAALPILDEGRLCREYLVYALSKMDASKTTDRAVMGATLNKRKLAELKIPLPPLTEQKRIAAILDKADAIRRKRQQAIQLADEFLRSVFLDMFGDPVTNPKGLDKAPITTLAEVITGFAFKSKEYVSDSSGAVRLCRGANTLTGYFDWGDTVYWPKDQITGVENYLIREGDVILAMDRPWISSGLKVCIFPKNERDTYLVQRVARLRPLLSFYTDYIYSCIQSNAFEKHCCPTETTVPHISPVELKNFEVLIPDEPTVLKYHEIVSRTRASISKMTLTDKLNEDGFSSLSQKAFSGNL